MHPPETRAHALALIRAGHNDCDVSRRTGIPRTTIRDWRRPRYLPRANGRHGTRSHCIRCREPTGPVRWSCEDYAELLGLYLGDGHITELARTSRLRLFLDSKHQEVVSDSRDLLKRVFPCNRVGSHCAHEGRLTILQVHSKHLLCMFPQHGPGQKHLRTIALAEWQQELTRRAPWHLLKGLIRSDGCSFVNKTGRYRYLAYQLDNHSQDILQIFCDTCDLVGLEYRRYRTYVRINRRDSVARLKDKIGVKR